MTKLIFFGIGLSILLTGTSVFGKDCLDSWRKGRTLKNDVPPQGVYRLIYEEVRIAFDKEGNVCQCYYKVGKGDTRTPTAKRTGKIGSGNKIQWTEIQPGTYPTNKPLSQESVFYSASMPNTPHSIPAELLVDYYSDGSCQETQLLSEVDLGAGVMTTEQVFRCQPESIETK